jgi:hypothetical protein
MQQFLVYYPDVCLELNVFRAFSRPSSGAQRLQWQPLVLPSYRGDSRAVFVVGPVDVESAHESTDREQMYVAMNELNIPQILISLVRMILILMQSQIKIQSKLSAPFKIHEGVRN